jgi:SEC-C motif
MAALHAPAADSPFPGDGVRIPLHEGLLLLEYQTGWLKEPVQKVDDALDVLLNIDFSNGRQVGRKLSSAWDAVIEAVAEALDLAAFLDNFGTDDWESVVDWARADLERTSLRALEALEELAPEPDGGGDASELALGDHLGGGDEPLGSEISGIRDQLAEVNRMDFPAPSPGEAQWAALGGGEIADHATDAEFAAAGAIQLRLICPPESVHPSMARDYLLKALRVGGCTYPLLAHRTAWFTHQLVERAFNADHGATKAEVQRFFGEEAGKIMSAGLRIEEHLTGFYRDGDRLAMLQAYRMLAEGVLRPYGQLVLRLERLVGRSELGPWKPRLLLGSLVDGFTAAGTELCRHLLRGTDTSFRNADAHADAVVSASGEVQITTEEGDRISVALREIETRFWLMRSALNGVDTIDLVFHRGWIDPNDVVQRHTDASLAYMAKLIARDHMSTGSVERLKIDPGAVSIVVSGAPEAGEAETTLRFLTKFLPPTIVVGKAVDEDGNILVEVVPLSGERPGRNDPCPCGSGKKFKRCHGG